MRLAAILRSAAATAPPRLTLYTGTRCSLCDEVKEVLTELRAEGARFELETVNIHDRQDPSTKRWRRLYQYDIPVLHLEGRQVAKHRVDKSRLAELLKEEEQTSAAR